MGNLQQVVAGLAILSDGLAVVLGALSRIGGCCVASYACHTDGSLSDRSQIVLTFHVSSSESCSAHALTDKQCY